MKRIKIIFSLLFLINLSFIVFLIFSLVSFQKNKTQLPIQQHPFLNTFAAYINKNDNFLEIFDEEFISKKDCNSENEGINDRHYDDKYYWIGCYWDPKKKGTDFWIKNYYLERLKKWYTDFSQKHKNYLYKLLFLNNKNDKNTTNLGQKQTEFNHKKNSNTRNWDANETKIELDIDNLTRKYTSLFVKSVTWKVKIKNCFKNTVSQIYNFKLDTKQKFSKKIFSFVTRNFAKNFNLPKYYFNFIDTYFRKYCIYQKSKFDIVLKKHQSNLFIVYLNTINEKFLQHLINLHNYGFGYPGDKNGLKISYFFYWNLYHIKNEKDNGNPQKGYYFINQIHCNHKKGDKDNKGIDISNPNRKDGKWIFED